jgi:hypothetical protein
MLIGETITFLNQHKIATKLENNRCFVLAADVNYCKQLGFKPMKLTNDIYYIDLRRNGNESGRCYRSNVGRRGERTCG